MTPPTPDAIDWKLILDYGQAAVTVIIGLYLWITDGKKATTKRIDDVDNKVSSRIDDVDEKIDKRFDNYSNRLTTVEEYIKHSPDLQTIQQLHSRMNSVQKTVSRQEGQLDGMSKQLDLIHKALLERDK